MTIPTLTTRTKTNPMDHTPNMNPIEAKKLMIVDKRYLMDREN